MNTLEMIVLVLSGHIQLYGFKGAARELGKKLGSAKITSLSSLNGVKMEYIFPYAFEEDLDMKVV